MLFLIGAELWYLFSSSHIPLRTITPRNIQQQQTPAHMGSQSDYLSPPNGVTFVNANGTPAPVGTISLSSDQSLLTFVGRIISMKQQGPSLLAQIFTNNTQGKPVLQPILLYDAKANLPFTLQTQKTHDLFPTSDTYTVSRLSNANSIQKALTPFLNTDLVISVLLAVSPPPSVSPAEQQLVAKLASYLPCNNALYQGIQGSTQRLPCIPYVYQVGAYVP